MAGGKNVNVFNCTDCIYHGIRRCFVYMVIEVEMIDV